MSLKTFKPYTKSNRGTVIVDKSSLWKGGPYKSLTKGQKSLEGGIIMEELLLDTEVVASNINIE